MRRLIIVSSILLCAGGVRVKAAAPVDVDRMVEAIRVAEGIHSRHPYGVLSVKVNSEAEAKAVCRNSVTNNIRRWEKAGKPGSFVEFMASRWCPASADPVGHENWIKNVNKFMGEK